jgi:hypothetical protein
VIEITIYFRLFIGKACRVHNSNRQSHSAA